MPLKSRANKVELALDNIEKDDINNAIFRRCANILMTAPTVSSNKSSSMKLREKVQYRELPEWIQEFEKIYELAPPAKYGSKADLYRCMARMGLYIVTLLFENKAKNEMNTEALKVIKESKEMQVMLQALAREAMVNDVKKQYDEIRKREVARNQPGLAQKLSEIESKETAHIENIMRDSRDDNIITIARIVGESFI